MKLRNMIKKGTALCTAVGLALSLTGCVLFSSPEDLYCLPRLPAEYVDLESELATLVNSGYEYAAPTSGENVQIVQMVDINGDDVDEALVFLKKAGDEKPLKICLFKLVEGGYEVAGVIEESAVSIDRVDYCDMNGDGNQELIVGWQIMNHDPAGKHPNEDSIPERALFRVLSVYNLQQFECRKELETNYNRYAITDLDHNGLPELVTLTGNMSGSSSAMAYSWNVGGIELMSTAKLSTPAALLKRIQKGQLSDGCEALFVTGAVDEKTLATDILILQDGALSNCVMDEVSGMSRVIYRDIALPIRDIYGNGILELPIAYELKKPEPDSKVYWGVHWTSISSKGEGCVVETTYHNLTDGWYLVLPESWKDDLMVLDVSSTTGERAVTFGIDQGEDREPRRILTIYTETGDSREYKANKGERFMLLRLNTTIYAAEFLEGYAQWSGAMSKEELRGAFHQIRTEWRLD